ncbi:MAG: nitrophenyl compound nitroreductase subunit ArsF family protein [Spirochaetes bacterium]|jgi:hypothetical protein|nr:nitrophenyl compound nitroreductase subunit ArsF family protein [Spirochaetota bacterium]
MNFEKITFIFVFSVIFLAGNLSSAISAQAAAGDKKIIVYYFHGDFRCQTCLRIEELTKKAVNDGFKNEMVSSKIELKIINIDKPGNNHFVNDYNLKTKSVIISEFTGSKQVRWKNLPGIWNYHDNESSFIRYIRDEVKGYL